MFSYAYQVATLTSVLSLDSPPVAVVFSEEPPAGVTRVGSAALAGCAYWKQAAEGHVFYTAAADHLGCAIGAHTHGAELEPSNKAELERMLALMTEVGYIAAEEVPSIPVRPGKLAFVTYAPLTSTPAQPDLVLIRCTARASMLLSEAVHAAAARADTAPVMRPACAMLPQVLASARAATSFGCMGNRLYTGLPDGEMWHTLPGASLDAIVGKLSTIAAANRAIAAFHEGRMEAAARMP